MATPEIDVKKPKGIIASLLLLAFIGFIMGITFTAGAHYFNWLIA